jgi:hypothetical protein
MPLVSYEQTRPWAKAMKDAVLTRKMPPWFADSRHGKFANNPSLTPEDIRTIASWVDRGAPAGDPRHAPAAANWVEGWNIPEPDHVVRMPEGVTIPSSGDIDYTYQIVSSGFKEDRWVQMSEIRPGSRQHVHHAVVYIRPPDSKWLRTAPRDLPFTASSLQDPEAQREARSTDSDILLVYAPGSSPDVWPAGMAKFVPAGSDFVFQMHYTSNGRPTRDRSTVGLVFADRAPDQRILTLQLTNGSFAIPAHAQNHRVEAWGSLPNDATLLSLFPHMHARGKRFEYNIVETRGRIETLLRVNYDFFWQLSYRLAQPRLLKAGTRLQAIAWYDNSRNNPRNPDPERTVTWGDQTSDEMMVGFFDVAVPRGVDKKQFFIRQ